MLLIFNWVYFNFGIDLYDIFFSLVYVKREVFFKNIFMIGCELDMLVFEVWRMICSLVGKCVLREDEVVGRQMMVKEGELIMGNDDWYVWEEVIKMDGGVRYKWLLVLDQVYGFD